MTQNGSHPATAPVVDVLPEGQETPMRALFEAVFGHAVTPEHWHWKYHAGPRLGSVQVAAHDASGRWPGHIGALVFPGVVQGRPLPMAQVCDVMVHPDARGGLASSGLYPRLLEALCAELSRRFPGAYAYGYPGLRPFRLGERLRRYRRLSVLDETTLDGPPPARPFGWQAEPVDWCDVRTAPWLDTVWHRLGDRDPAPRVARTAAWLHWRYATHPTQRYRLWRLTHLWRPAGWLVTATPTGEVRWLVDACLPGPAGVAPALQALRAACASLGEPHALSTWLPGPDATALRPSPIVPTEFRIEAFHTDLPVPRFQPGDTDVF